MNDSSQRAIIDLRQTLSQIIPWISAQQAPRMILAQKPLRLPSDISVKHQPAPSLRVDGKNKSNLFLAQYKNEAMHAIRFPYLCYVLEGEIDMRLGIPSGQRKTIDNYQLLTLPVQTCLVIPPGVFYPDLQQSLKSSPLPPCDSKVFWIRTLPNGVFCHTSTMRGGKYSTDHRDVFVPDLRLSVLVEMLMDELQSTEKNSLLAAQNALSLLLLRIERGLRDGAQAATGRAWEPIQNVQSQEAKLDTSKLIAKSVIIERACNYILTHLDKPFSTEDVASYAYVSSSYLTRLFRADLKTSVMEYALKERLKTAHSLLANTEVSIQQIARFVGYSQTPQFNRIFKRIHGVTPTQFRRDQRINHNMTRKAKK